MKSVPGIISVLVKDTKGGLKVTIYDSVGWSVNIVVGGDLCRGVDGEGNIS